MTAPTITHAARALAVHLTVTGAPDLADPADQAGPPVVPRVVELDYRWSDRALPCTARVHGTYRWALTVHPAARPRITTTIGRPAMPAWLAQLADAHAPTAWREAHTQEAP